MALEKTAHERRAAYRVVQGRIGRLVLQDVAVGTLPPEVEVVLARLVAEAEQDLDLSGQR